LSLPGLDDDVLRAIISPKAMDGFVTAISITLTASKR